MLGGNRLAIEALPLLTTAPGTRHLLTTGFKGHRSSDTVLTWPVWTAALTVDVVRSILTLGNLQQDRPDGFELFPRDIPAAFRSRRITVGKVRNFTPAANVINDIVS